MKITKLKDGAFCGFASLIVNQDIEPYDPDLRIIRKDDSIEMIIYFSGEMEDKVEFIFKDCKCFLKTFKINTEKHDLSHQWVTYIMRHPDLTTEEKQDIVNAYNKKIEEEIEDFSRKKSEELIC